MSLQNQIITLRKKCGLSQVELADKISVARQTVSKWELGVTVPDLENCKALCTVFGVSLDYLTEEIMPTVSNTMLDSLVEEIDWTKAWSKKYPILSTYATQVDIAKYQKEIGDICKRCQQEYNLSLCDAMLVVKDMLYQYYKSQSKKL